MEESKYKTTIGLEIHAELKTQTKMFCDSKNDPDEKTPNINICPVCTAQPGTLPVINKEAVKNVIKVGVAVGGEIATFTEFDRKNYFYPDIPKGYQISQYKYPIVKGGSILGFELTRIHLEEDTARSTHDKGEHSLVDFNRAGIPLMELVTEPVIHSPVEAGRFARELQLLLRTLGVSDANMEKGEMRVEANISVSKTDRLGTKVEVKNLNSFKVVEKAIQYEVERHIKALESGEELVQETRGWDEAKQKTFSQRIKETSEDYRYFPDPDLPKLRLDEVPEFDIEKIKSGLPELPWEKRERYINIYNIKKEDADVYVVYPVYGKFFDSVYEALENKKDAQLASNYITSDLFGYFKDLGVPDNLSISAIDFADLIKIVSSGDVSSRGAKDILKIMLDKGGAPMDIAKENNLLQMKDEGAIKEIVESLIRDNSGVVEEYKKGKETALKFLMGQGMKATKGSADPQMLEKLLKELIGQ